MTATAGTQISDSVSEVLPRIEKTADDSERARRIDQSVIDALTATGVFHAFVPAERGGSEVDLPASLRLFEEVSATDGSTGWVTMILASSGILAAYLPPDGAKEIFGEGPGAVTCGVVAPRGKAVTVDGGYRVSGRWPYASGCHHSSWIALNCMVETNGELETLPNGQPNLRFVMIPVSELEILDTWHVAGLRGTGSNDIAANDVFVPRDHTYGFITDPPLYSGTLYRVSIPSLFASAVAACALGIGRGALDEIREIAPTRSPMSRPGPLSEWSYTQVEYARAEAALRSSRAFLFESLQNVWDALDHGQEPSIAERALVRLAATHAVEGAVRAVDTAYALGGASAIYESSSLQRRFRDIHAMTQHFLVAPATIELSGRALLGLEMEPGFL
jgi:alkylation response protein AidB-like acyl-CoA dehydrogenase